MIQVDIYTKAFQKKVEDFHCDNCNAFIVGDGYRNHCSQCLISKHVDIRPGDRAANCGGLMQVVDITLDHGTFVLLHTCEKCGHQKKNKTHREDSIDTIIRYMTLLQL